MRSSMDSGMGHLVHHDKHYEYCWSLAERIDYICADKPPGEVTTRLKYIGLLPLGRLPADLKAAGQEFVAAREEFDAAREEFDAASETYDAARNKYYAAGQEFDAAREEFDAARETFAAAWKTYAAASETFDAAWKTYAAAWKTYAAVSEIFMATPDGQALHDSLWPDCPWDEQRRTMFPEED